MSKELGPREKALREMREAKFARHAPARHIRKADLTARIAEAAKKPGKPRRKK